MARNVDIDLAAAWCDLDVATLRAAGVEAERQHAIAEISGFLKSGEIDEAIARIEKLPKYAERFLQHRSQYRMDWLEPTIALDKAWARCAVVDYEAMIAIRFLRVNVVYGFDRKIRVVPPESEIDAAADRFLLELERPAQPGSLC